MEGGGAVEGGSVISGADGSKVGCFRDVMKVSESSGRCSCCRCSGAISQSLMGFTAHYIQPVKSTTPLNNATSITPLCNE